jgi:hypothetical protein
MSYRLLFVPVLLLATAHVVRSDEPPAKTDGTAKADANVQVQARGQIHESFAQPWDKNPAPNQAIKQKPPEPIAEEPPGQRPAGDNVQWIPGYWQFDADGKDFVWISGTWRNAPEHRRWAPGYWTDTQEGYRWINGHWAGEGEQDMHLVPTPPQSADNGPSSPVPDDHSFYIPGSWFYTDQGYRWRAGYWSDIRPGYSWVPASYYWTPQGWVFTNGFWDYDPYNRGLLFAPVRFTDRSYLAAGFVFRPLMALSTELLFDSLFYRGGWGHYYFGDYYGAGYAQMGFQPWALQAARLNDPLFAYMAYNNRANAQWLTTLQANAKGRMAGTVALPPRTLADQVRLSAAGGAKVSALVTPLADLQKSGVKLQAVSAQQRQTITQQAKTIVNRSSELSRVTSQMRVGAGVVPRIGERVGAGVQGGLTLPGTRVDGQGRIIQGGTVNPGQLPNPGNILPRNPGGTLPGGVLPGGRPKDRDR